MATVFSPTNPTAKQIQNLLLVSLHLSVFFFLNLSHFALSLVVLLFLFSLSLSLVADSKETVSNIMPSSSLSGNLSKK